MGSRDVIGHVIIGSAVPENPALEPNLTDLTSWKNFKWSCLPIHFRFGCVEAAVVSSVFWVMLLSVLFLFSGFCCEFETPDLK